WRAHAAYDTGKGHLRICCCIACRPDGWTVGQGVIRKSGYRFSGKIMYKQQAGAMAIRPQYHRACSSPECFCFSASYMCRLNWTQNGYSMTFRGRGGPAQLEQNARRALRLTCATTCVGQLADALFGGVALPSIILSKSSLSMTCDHIG